MDDTITHLSKVIQQYFFRNKGIADTISKLSSSIDKVTRSIVKAATHCGCIEFYAKKQPSLTPGEATNMMQGELCSRCREKIEQCIGESFFYLISLCIAMGSDPQKILQDQVEQMKILGKFNLR